MTAISNFQTDDLGFEPSHSQRVLVAGGEPDLRQLNAEVLIDVGHQVDVSDDGAAAWAALQTKQARKTMKLFKTATLTAVAVGLFGVCNAGASPAIIGTTTHYSTLNVALTITQTGGGKVSGQKYSYSTSKLRITNKFLLTVFQGWAGFIFPKGARLEIGWDAPWTGDVLVVDKTGTNVLFDATTTGNDSIYFFVDYFAYYGAYKENGVDANPGWYSYTDYNGGDFALYDNNYFLPYTYLWSEGASTVSYSEKWDKSGNYTGWKAKTSFQSNGQGGQYFLNSGSDTTTKGTINASGSGKDDNNSFFD